MRTKRKLSVLELDILTRTPNQADTIVFVPGFLAKFSLPNNPQKSTEFIRVNGDYKFVIVGTSQFGVPSGIYPRLILIFLATNARIYGEKTVFLGESFASFKKKVGVGTGGGSNGPSKRFKHQYKALFTASIKYYCDLEAIFDVQSINISRRSFTVFEKTNHIRGAIELEDSFFRDVLSKSFPVDERVVELLRKNCLALDIYFFLTLRFYSLRKTTNISFFQLNKQFGSSIQSLKNFRVKFINALTTIQSVVPQYKVKVSDSGIILYPSRPHVEIRG